MFRELDQERFREACNIVLCRSTPRNSIGTLSEKTLHAVLKRYYEPDAGRHEIKLGNYVADIVSDDGIIEIQTGNFNKLRNKLKAFLAENIVTLVYPLPHIKWLCWIDKETGEISKRRKSPKVGTPYDAFYELYKIKPLLRHHNLRLVIAMIDIIEYRNLDGWSNDRKRGSSRNERIPLSIASELYLDCPASYVKLLPDSLPEKFTVKDYARASKLSNARAGIALNVLSSVGAILHAGKNGRACVYERC